MSVKKIKIETKGFKLKTPKLPAKWIYITGNGSKKFEGEDREFKVTLILPEELATEWKDRFEELQGQVVEEFAKKGKKIKLADLPIKQEEDGQWIASFKMPVTSIINGEAQQRRCPIADSRGTLLTKAQTPNIGNGSLLKVNAFVSPFYVASIGAGVSLRLEAVQICRLVEYGLGDTSFAADDDEEAWSAGGNDDVEDDDAPTHKTTTKAPTTEDPNDELDF